MNELTVFENSNFGKVRVVMQDDEPWFVAKDVCTILGLNNVSEALTSLDLDEKRDITGSDVGSDISKLRTINESGLYCLVFKSRKPEAKEFKKWVTSEVLPSIRKTGGYNLGFNPKTGQKIEHPDWYIEGRAAYDMMVNLFKAPEHLAMSETAKWIKTKDGPDVANMMGQLPCSQNIAIEEMMLEPTELGKRFGLSGIGMNLRLERFGLQNKRGAFWEPTERGMYFSTRHAWGVGTKSGYNLKWNVSAITKMMEAYWKE
jgi:prophage antirepressor-like protein